MPYFLSLGQNNYVVNIILIFYSRLLIPPQISNMQHEKQQIRPTNILQVIATLQNVSFLTLFIGFLDDQTLEVIGQSVLKLKRQEKFYRIIIATLFIKKYVNRVDRSLFFLFYQDPQFQTIEKNTINKLAAKQYQFLHDSYLAYQEILQAIEQQVSFLENPNEFRQLIERFFFQPDLPLPKLIRQTVAMYCESPFQQMMALIRLPLEQLQEEQWMQPPLIKLRENLAGEGGGGDEGEDAEAMQMVRYCGFKVGKDWRKWLIGGFRTHNMLVLLFALSERIVFTSSVLIADIEDPFMRLIEFCLRSSLFRNSALLVEEKLPFLFSNYSHNYQQKYHSPANHPVMNFWRPALSIWSQKMSNFHDKNMITLNYISSKLREQSLKEFLKIKTEKLPSFYTNLKEHIQMQIYSNSKKQQTYSETEQKVEIEQFFEQNYEMYEVLTKQYLQYMSDISMNEFNVHWCGHSLHSISSHKLFTQFSNSIIKESAEFYKFIKDILYYKLDEDIRLIIFREVVKEDLHYIDNKIVKPVTLRQIVALFNQLIKAEVYGMNQYAVFGEQCVVKYKVALDFEEKDNLVSYFANKAQIHQECPKDKWFLYNIIDSDEYNWKLLLSEKEENGGESDAEIEGEHTI